MEHLYCRLCAETKPSSKLIDLQSDDTRKRQIMQKLLRLNVDFIDFSTVDKLPKHVCLYCIDSLDKTLEFLSHIHEAQSVLRGIFINKLIKEENDNTLPKHGDEVFANTNFTFDDVKNEQQAAMEVKLEYEDGDSDRNDDVELDVCVKPRKTRKKRRKINTLADVLDALDNDVPLSKLKCMTWKDYPWFCLYCDKQFFDLQQLTQHSMDMHTSCTPFKCVDCNSRMNKSLDRFLMHVYKHKKHLKFFCYMCNEEFSTIDEAKLHKTEHDSKSSIKCNGCNTAFDNFDQYKEHSVKYYKINVKIRKSSTSGLSCDICNKTFATRGNLNKHQQIHTERHRDQTCEKCGKRFYDKGTLTSHMLLHEDSRKYKCEICKSGFRTASQLRTHVGIHGGPRPYSCEQCGRSFRLRTHLKSHMIIHTDNLPHICEYCSKAFRFKTILTQHLRQHTGIKPYSCEHCLREFTNWPNYNKHMKRRHSMDMSKKKHTPEGVFPINPLTGEILPLPASSKTEEWRKNVMVPRQRGRPKLRPSGKDIKSNLELPSIETNVEPKEGS